jgi:hypothetical protein
MRAAAVIAPVLVFVACGGRVVDDAASTASGAAVNDSFPVLGTRCLGAHGEVVRDACMLPAVPDFTPRRWAPPAPRQGACSGSQIDAFLQACSTADGGQRDACAAFQAAHADEPCLACLVTPDSAASFGPLVSRSDGSGLELNAGGCIALARGLGNADDCGARYQALTECTATACAACPGTTTDGQSRGCLCTTAAQGGACARYVTAAQCVKPLLDEGNADVAGCASGDDYVIARYFCLAH